MMSQTTFTAVIALFWLAEAVFGALVVYWFVTQGFAERGHATVAETRPLESWDYTKRSLTMWAGFFAAILVLIIVGA